MLSGVPGMGGDFMPGATGGGMDTTGPGAMDGFTGGLGLDSFGAGGIDSSTF